LDALDGFLADDVVFEFPGMQLAGPEAVKQMVQGWFATWHAYPDMAGVLAQIT